MSNNSDLNLSQSMSAVFYDMRESVSGEITAIRGQTDQIKSLLEDAIAALHEAFGSIHASTNEQMQTMTTLMMQVVGTNNEQNIFQQAESASDILTELVDTLLHSSKNNLRALTAMDALRSRMKQIVVMDKQQSSMIDQLCASADAESFNSERVCELAHDLREHQLKQAAFTLESMTLFKKAHHLIDNIASKDMDEVFASKVKVEQIVQHFFAINNFVSDSRTTVNQVNANIREQLSAAIRALQFEDISRQSLGHTDRHLDRMEGVMSILTNGLDELVAADISMDAYVKRVAAIHLAMVDYQHTLQLEETNPISQENMDEGDIDLF